MTVLPTVARDLDGLWLFGAASAAPLVSFVVATVVAGAWADHRGPVRPLQAGMLVFTVSQVAMALAPGMARLRARPVRVGDRRGADGRLADRAARPRHAGGAARQGVRRLRRSLGAPLLGGSTRRRAAHRGAVVAVGLRRRAWPCCRWPGSCCAVACAPRHRRRSPTATATRRQPAWTPREHRAVRAAALAAAGLAALTAGGSLLGRSGPVELLGVALVVVGTACTVPAVRTVLPAGTLRFARGIPALVALRGLVAAAFGTAGSLLPLMLTTIHGLGPGRGRREPHRDRPVLGGGLTAARARRRCSAGSRPYAGSAIGFALITVGVLGPGPHQPRRPARRGRAGALGRGRAGNGRSCRPPCPPSCSTSPRSATRAGSRPPPASPRRSPRRSAWPRRAP